MDVSQKFGRKLVNVTCLYGIGEPIRNASAMPARPLFSKAPYGAETEGTRDTVLTPFYASDDHLRILRIIIQYIIVTRPVVCCCFDSCYKYIFCFFVYRRYRLRREIVQMCV